MFDFFARRLYDKREVVLMPVRKVKGGYKWGTKGEVYKSRAKAGAQGKAIRASQKRRGKK